MKLLTLLAIAVLTGTALGQTGIKPPCEYAAELLRKPDGKIALLTSDEMKTRATYKQDITGPIKQADIKGTAIIDVLVAPDGHVLCTKSLHGHPMIRKSVEVAVGQWRFSPADVDGRKVAYLGRMEFTLCQISCGESGPWMTIVQDRQDSQKHYDLKRCKPKVLHQPVLPKDLNAVQKGEKPSGYPPLISFEILESGEVANLRVKRSSGYSNIDSYALNWIPGTRYNSRSGCGVIESEAVVLINWTSSE